MPDSIITETGVEDVVAGIMEFKFVSADGAKLPAGEFTGYGAVFGNVDSHGDVVLPGAFGPTLAKRKAEGRGLPPMRIMHGLFGGDGLPGGIWLKMDEDAKGLRVHGKISGHDSTEYGKRIWALMQDGALKGLSIGYTATEVERGANAGDPKRKIKSADLGEVSVVDDPSNALAIMDEMKRARGIDTKAMLTLPKSDRAAASIAAAMAVHQDCMAGGDSPTADERAALWNHLQDAHEHLTDRRMPVGMKASAPNTIRELEKALTGCLGFSKSQARDIATSGFKGLQAPRDEGSGQASDREVKLATAARDALSFLS